MDRLRAFSVLVQVADTGSFTAAARELHMSRPSVSRWIADLEHHLGVSLLARTTRKLAFTEAGRQLVEEAREVLAAVDDAEARARGHHARPTGTLRVTAPVLFGRLHVLPVVQQALEQHPELDVQLILLNRVVDLVQEGFDIGVRIGHLPDSSLLATRVGEVRSVLVASPAYLADRPALTEARQLSEHVLIGRSDAPARWGPDARIEVSPRLWTNDVATAIDAARQGFGISRALSYQVAEDLEAGVLVEVLPGLDPTPIPVHLLRPPGRPPAKTRAFVAAARAVLTARSAKGWNASATAPSDGSSASP